MALVGASTTSGMACALFSTRARWGGVGTILRLVPEHDLVIAVLTNGESDLAGRTADDALAALFPDFRKKLEEERAQATPVAAKEGVTNELQGRWGGEIETHEGLRSLELEIHSAFAATAILNGVSATVDELQMRKGRLVGVFDGEIGTEDAGRRKHRIHLDLGVEPDRLYGAALTMSDPPQGTGGAPGNRYGSALAYWTELKAL